MQRVGICSLGVSVLAAFALSALVPAQDIGERLGYDLTGLEPLEWSAGESQVAEIGEIVGRDCGFLMEASFRSARGKPWNYPEAIDLVVCELPLDGDLAGTHLFCAVDPGGELAGATLVGREDFDSDPELAWSLFLGQMCTFGALGADGEFAQRPADPARSAQLDAYEEELAERDDDDAVLLRALLRQRVIMRELAVFQRKLVLQKDSLPPAEWVARQREQMEEVVGFSHGFARIMGSEGAGRHGELGAQAVQYLRGMEAAAEQADGEAFAQLQGRMRSVCGSCHRQRLDGTGANWDDHFETLRTDLGVPSGFLRVGFDLAPALGDDGEQSQQIADSARAALLLVAMLREQ